MIWRRFCLGVIVTGAALVLPTAADAGFREEMKAANKVEQKMDRRYPGYDITAVCDQETRTRFYCKFIGSRGDCFVSGKAWVRKGRVSVIVADKDCF